MDRLYPRPIELKVVFDTNVVVSTIWARDPDSGAAISLSKTLRHIIVVCEKLLREYRGVLAQGNRQMYSLVDLLLMQVFPIDLLDKRADPVVSIDFGPEEDRFHMQLAIDSASDHHVSWEHAVLAEAHRMAQYGVAEVNPRDYVARNGG